MPRKGRLAVAVWTGRMGITATLAQAKAQAAGARVVRIPYAPFGLTQPIHWSSARFRVLDCGRQFGKTTVAIVEGFNMTLDAYRRTPHRLPRGVIVAPSYDLVKEDWRVAMTLLKDVIVQAHIADFWLDLGPFGLIEFKSSDREGGVGRGAGYDWAVLDEAARIPASAWEEDLRPALSVRSGRALFISTPKGRNWFYDLWRKGQTPGGEVQSWRYSTIEGWRSRLAKNPEALRQANQEWEAVVSSTSMRTLQQEWLAEFLEHDGQFLHVGKIVGGALREAVPGRTYLVGLDPARVQDFMVTAVMEVESRQLVALCRSQHRSWDLQLAEVVTLLKGYPTSHVLIDATGLGDPIAQRLMQLGVSVETIRFTNSVKKQLVENLALACDQALIQVPQQPETDWLLDELADYQEWETASGNIRYGASEGKHDDGVTALMLALWGMRFDLQAPVEAPQPLARAPGDFTVEEFLAFTKQSAAWRQAYPSVESPSHPWALGWASRPNWRRRMGRG